MNMKKILEMKAKREDARLKAMAVLNKAEAEDRFLSEDPKKSYSFCLMSEYLRLKRLYHKTNARSSLLFFNFTFDTIRSTPDCR